MFILIYKLFVDYASFLNLFQATLMLATVNVNRLATYRTYLKEGSIFSDATSLDEITKPASPIPEECFRLVSSDTGHASAAPLLRGYAKVEPLTIAELK
ncbi:unnamed protein product [Brassica rapa subsp. narinosa]